MTEKQEKAVWFVTVSASLNSALEEAILKDTHSTKSEFIRDVVREKLEKMGYKPKIKFGNMPKTEKEIES